MFPEETKSGVVQIVPAQDSQTTGNFEITVNGKLVHSKKTLKHGFLVRQASLRLFLLFQHENPEQQKVVQEAIKTAIAAK